MDTLIEWTCDGCGGRVRGSQGYLHISKVEIGLFEIAHEEWERKLQEMAHARAHELVEELGIELEDVGLPFVVLTPDMLEDNPHPPPVRWQVHHRKCDPNVEGDDFFLLVEDVPTFKKLLRASVDNIMCAPWIDVTNWHEFIMSITTEGH